MNRFLFVYLLIFTLLACGLILFAFLKKTQNPESAKVRERTFPKRKFVIDQEDETYEMRYFFRLFSLK